MTSTALTMQRFSNQKLADTSSKHLRNWNAMVFLFKDGGALDTGTPPRKHSHRVQIEKDAVSLTSTALTNLQKYVNKNTHVLEDL